LSFWFKISIFQQAWVALPRTAVRFGDAAILTGEVHVGFGCWPAKLALPKRARLFWGRALFFLRPKKAKKSQNGRLTCRGGGLFGAGSAKNC
jgi:hypothetical protein